jgi:hypothetical protein
MAVRHTKRREPVGAVPAAGDLVVVRVKSTCGGEPCINDMSFRIENPAANWADMVTQVRDDLDNAIGILGAGVWPLGRSTAFNSYAMDVVDVLPSTSPLAELLLTAPGTVAEDVMPPNDSVCVTLRTAVKGKTGRGRMYLNGYPESAANGGYWEAAAQNAASAIAQNLLDNLGALNEVRNMTWGVISRFEAGVKRSVPAFTPIDSFTVHNEVRTLRRRAVGVRISRHRAP